MGHFMDVKQNGTPFNGGWNNIFRGRLKPNVLVSI